MIKNKNIINNILEYILVIALVMLSLAKGGFYKSDLLLVAIIISIISFIYSIINIIGEIKSKKYKIDIIEILLFILSFSYTLPIIFNNYADLNSSIFEAIRYFDLYLIYAFVKRSNNKKIYINTIIGITLLQCILGIDAIGSRYLENILSSIGSGYLDQDFTRMSGTLQYANILAILCLLSLIYIFKLIKSENKITKYILYFVMNFILISTIILTGTRTVIILTLLSFIALFIINKSSITKNICIYIPTIILTGIYSSIIYDRILTQQVYYIFAIFIILSIITAILIYKLKELYNKRIKNKIKINKAYYILIILFAVIYIILSFNITKPIVISSNSKNQTEEIILDNIKKDNNEIQLEVKTYKEDTRYKIKLTSVDNKNIEKEIKTFNYWDNTSGKFSYNFKLDDNQKYIKMYINCEKGKISIDKVYLNNIKQKIDYVLIPRNIINRFKDLINGSTSTNDRITYYKDAIKIICKNIPNFIIGTGGEGFNNIYEQIKSKDYYSTEVHSSFLQIFVESGIIGFAIIAFILVYTIIKAKNNYTKFAYFIFIIHSLFDLNFSYMIGIAIFGILLAHMDYNQNEINIKSISLIFKLLGIICNILVIVILIKSILAMYIRIPKYNEDNINLEQQIKVVNKNEKRVMLDPYEYNYRKELDKQYDIYLKMLYKDLNNNSNENNKNIFKEEIKNVLDNILINANKIFNNNKFNQNQNLYACNIYFRNLDNLSSEYYKSDKKRGYEIYEKIIFNKLDYLLDIYNKNKYITETITNVKQEYSTKLKNIAF